ncbi:MAG: amino acid ABC transporter permease [Candidatus Limnocylindria bacterium]
MTGAIVERVARAQSRARSVWRARFIGVWVVIIALLLVFLASTDNLDFAWIEQNWIYIVQGAGLTVVISAASIALATVLALIGALGRLSSVPEINGIAAFYVSLFRGTPLIVQIFFVYFALPQVGIVLPAIPTGIIALGLNYGAYMTEIFRAGIQAVSTGQREAAQALAMPDRLLFRRIVLPQAIRIVTPAVGNEFIAMIKDSALVNFIGVQELFWRAEVTGTRDARTLQAFAVAAAFYWLVTIAFSFFQDRIEKRMARGDR